MGRISQDKLTRQKSIANARLSLTRTHGNHANKENLDVRQVGVVKDTSSLPGPKPKKSKPPSLSDRLANAQNQLEASKNSFLQPEHDLKRTQDALKQAEDDCTQCRNENRETRRQLNLAKRQVTWAKNSSTQLSGEVKELKEQNRAEIDARLIVERALAQSSHVLAQVREEIAITQQELLLARADACRDTRRAAQVNHEKELEEIKRKKDAEKLRKSEEKTARLAQVVLIFCEATIEKLTVKNLDEQIEVYCECDSTVPKKSRAKNKTEKIIAVKKALQDYLSRFPQSQGLWLKDLKLKDNISTKVGVELDSQSFEVDVAMEE